ncbi:MAG: Sec-independent protein translocase subunit TatA/TatB [Candidatus Promineifilaceae bacterium]
MDTGILNIGFSELVFILILAGLVMGPNRIRDVARWLGQTTAKLQGISRQFRNQLNNELDAAEKEDLRGALDDIKDLRRQVVELRRELVSVPQDINQAAKDAEQDAAVPLPDVAKPSAAENSIAPSNLPNLVDIDDDLE